MGVPVSTSCFPQVRFARVCSPLLGRKEVELGWAFALSHDGFDACQVSSVQQLAWADAGPTSFLALTQT